MFSRILLTIESYEKLPSRAWNDSFSSSYYHSPPSLQVQRVPIEIWSSRGGPSRGGHLEEVNYTMQTNAKSFEQKTFLDRK